RGVRGAQHEGQDDYGAHTQISSTAVKPSRAASRSEATLSSSAPHTGSRPAARSSRIIAAAAIVARPSWRAPGSVSTETSNHAALRHGAYAKLAGSPSR